MQIANSLSAFAKKDIPADLTQVFSCHNFQIVGNFNLEMIQTEGYRQTD